MGTAQSAQESADGVDDGFVDGDLVGVTESHPQVRDVIGRSKGPRTGGDGSDGGAVKGGQEVLVAGSTGGEGSGAEAGSDAGSGSGGVSVAPSRRGQEGVDKAGVVRWYLAAARLTRASITDPPAAAAAFAFDADAHADHVRLVARLRPEVALWLMELVPARANAATFWRNVFFAMQVELDALPLTAGLSTLGAGGATTAGAGSIHADSSSSSGAAAQRSEAQQLRARVAELEKQLAAVTASPAGQASSATTGKGASEAEIAAAVASAVAAARLARCSGCGALRSAGELRAMGIATTAIAPPDGKPDVAALKSGAGASLSNASAAASGKGAAGTAAAGACAGHTGKWTLSDSAVEFAGLADELKANLRREKRKRLAEAAAQLKWVPDDDSLEHSCGKWSCCNAEVYGNEGCAKVPHQWAFVT